MDGELKSFIKVSLTIMVSLLYSYFIASKIPKGKFRLFSLFPVFFLFALLPPSLSSIFLTGTVAFFITWLTTFKLFLFSFNLGPLVSDPPLTFPLFASVACLPIKIKPKETDQDYKYLKKYSNPKLGLNLPAKILLFAILIAIDDRIDRLRPNAKLCVYCATLYLFLDVLLGVSSAFVRLAFDNVVLEPSSNEPYLATSLQDFWGRRWNLLVSNTLRYGIYRPVRAAVEGVVGKRLAAGTGVMAVFVASGVMHEQLVYYITREVPTWEVTWFFVLQGVSVVVESELKAVVGRWWRPPAVVAWLLTLTFLVVTAAWLFFPPLLRAGIFAGLLRELKMVEEFAWKLVLRLF
ncbi:probable long-chain-alcohol O-fatty-acyltransferase 5 [Benincasa hispida]|uniref:probable long-chain-alcohol O-fatty-acyltransferase 5 n=1 Tax=Benincasa hispida TaxID=102211 RepID=UPI0019016522|nr:probable long-chain-alcohol O-fatty-acyltransferase 5 [Benincasa hispida]